VAQARCTTECAIEEFEIRSRGIQDLILDPMVSDFWSVKADVRGPFLWHRQRLVRSRRRDLGTAEAREEGGGVEASRKRPQEGIASSMISLALRRKRSGSLMLKLVVRGR